MKVIGAKPLVRYQNDVLETAADVLVATWFEVKSYPSVVKHVERSLNDSDSIASECIVR